MDYHSSRKIPTCLWRGRAPVGYDWWLLDFHFLTHSTRQFHWDKQKSLKTLELLPSSSISLRQACLVRFLSSFSDPLSGRFVMVEDPTLHTLHPDLATSTKFICTGNGLPGKARKAISTFGRHWLLNTVPITSQSRHETPKQPTWKSNQQPY